MINFSMSVAGAAEREAELRKFARMLDRPVINAFRRGVRRIATTVRKEIRGEGIGRSIWGKKASGLGKLVYGMRVTKVGDDLTTGIKVKGIPALVEEGGRIAAHIIKPGRIRGAGQSDATNRPLASAARSFFSASPVRHPGMTLGARHFGRSAVARETPAILEDLNREIGVLKQETFE